MVRHALGQGWVQILNDVDGLRNPEMVEVVKAFQVPVVVMHMFGQPQTMQQDFHYEDVVRDLMEFFRVRLDEAGLQENVVIDPGLGFGKSVEHNLAIVRRLPEFKALGHPILLGASRKSFIGKVLDVEVEDRLEGSLAVAAMAAWQGASILRVHEVRATSRVLKMITSIGEISVS